MGRECFPSLSSLAAKITLGPLIAASHPWCVDLLGRASAAGCKGVRSIVVMNLSPTCLALEMLKSSLDPFLRVHIVSFTETRAAEIIKKSAELEIIWLFLWSLFVLPNLLPSLKKLVWDKRGRYNAPYIDVDIK